MPCHALLRAVNLPDVALILPLVFLGAFELPPWWGRLQGSSPEGVACAETALSRSSLAPAGVYNTTRGEG
jgi:hypothetical protein